MAKPMFPLRKMAKPRQEQLMLQLLKAKLSVTAVFSFTA